VTLSPNTAEPRPVLTGLRRPGLPLRTQSRTFAGTETDMTTITATEARRRLYSLVDEANASHEPVLIAGKRGGAVLLSQEDWSAIQETLYLLSVKGMRESIRKGLKTPLRACRRELLW